MKKFALLLLFLTAACNATPEFTTVEFARFESAKYPPVMLRVNSGQACFTELSCTYSDKFFEKIRASGAFHQVDDTNPLAKYLIRVTLRVVDDEETRRKETLRKNTLGLIPVHIRRNFSAKFQIDDVNGMLKTYNYTLTGTQLETLGSDESDKDKLYDSAIGTLANYFIAGLQRDNILPLSENPY